MSFSESILTAGLTTGLGLFAFVVGQLAVKLYVEPIQEQARTSGKVTHALTYYRSVGSERPDENETVRWQRIAEAKGAYRELAAELRMNLRVLPMYWVFARLQWVLPEERIRCAAAELTVLSNIAQKAPDTKDRMHHTYELKAALGIRD